MNYVRSYLHFALSVHQVQCDGTSRRTGFLSSVQPSLGFYSWQCYLDSTGYDFPRILILAHMESLWALNPVSIPKISRPIISLLKGLQIKMKCSFYIPFKTKALSHPQVHLFEKTKLKCSGTLCSAVRPGCFSYCLTIEQTVFTGLETTVEYLWTVVAVRK